MSDTNNKSTDSRKRCRVVVAVCIILTLILGGVAIVRYAKQSAESAKLQELADRSNMPNIELVEETLATEQGDESAETTDPAEEGPMTPDEKADWYLETYGIEIPAKNLDFADLQTNTNGDIYAWIYIPDTKIDYPVLQHPTDNSYYLNYNLDGSKGYPGCIYTEDYNAKDFSDPMTVMYGHNMKNGTMFAGLHRYSDAEFFDENPYIFIYTENDVLVYEIFAAYQAGDAHLLYNKDYSVEVVYRDYIDEVYETRSMNSNFNEDCKPVAGDEILTLSTCIANKPNNRYLVQGVLLDEN